MENLELRIGHICERHDSTRHKAVEKAVLAVPAARLVLQFFSHNLRDDNIVRNGHEDTLTIFASVKIDQNTRVENKRIHDINQGA